MAVRIALSAVFAFGGTASLAAPLTLVTDVWIPFENLSHPEAPGFSTEVLRHVFNAMGQEAAFEEYPWARAAALVFSGERDALYTAFYNEERARFCFFPSESLARDKWVLFVRSDEAGKLRFTSLDDLKGYRIGVLRGASVSPEFWDFVRRESYVEEVSSDEINFRKLEAGRVDYIVASYFNGSQLIGSLGLRDKVVPLLSKSLKEDDLYVIFSKKRVTPGFVAAFSAALHDFKQTDTFQAISRKYFSGSPSGG
jgi:polar amino acid transport system substrate-binding protein